MKWNEIHQQTSATVFSGLLINYPLNLVLLWFILQWLEITNPFVVGTMITFFMTIFAYIRVYVILRWFEKREPLP
mgnify:CR=1 FL=1